MILLTILTLVFIYARATEDARLIKKEEIIFHIMNATLSICMGSFLSWVILGSLIGLPYFLSIYWLTFDPLLNKLRGKELLYVGTTAWLDRSFRKITIYIHASLFYLKINVNKISKVTPGRIMLVAKIICLGISIWVFIHFAK